MTVCELIHDMHDTSNSTLSEDPLLILANEAITECKPHIDKRVFINSLTINAVCLIGSIVSGFLSNRVGRRTMPGKHYSM